MAATDTWHVAEAEVFAAGAAEAEVFVAGAAEGEAN